MNEVVIMWLVTRVLAPLAFWLSGEHHEWVHRTMDELKEAKREGLTLRQWRRKHAPVG